MRCNMRTFFIVVEVLQERQKFLLVAPQNRLDLRWLLRVRDEDLEDVECFELDILTLVTEEIHHQLQVRLRSNVSSHDSEICAVEQDFSQQLQRLPLGDVVLGVDKEGEEGEELCMQRVFSAFSSARCFCEITHTLVVLLKNSATIVLCFVRDSLRLVNASHEMPNVVPSMYSRNS